MVNLKEIEQIYSSIPTPCIILNTDAPTYSIVFANPAFIQATYTNLDHIIGRPFFNVFPDNVDDEDGKRTENFTAGLDQALWQKSPHLLSRHRYDLSTMIGSEQEVRFWNVETYPLMDLAGNVQYIIQSSTNVTALVLAEQQLAENNKRLSEELKKRISVEAALQLSNERYAYVNMATKDAICDWNIVSDKVEWGYGFLINHGYSTNDQFPITEWMELLHPDDNARLLNSLSDALNDSGRHSWTGEYRLRRMDGSYADIEANGCILRDEQGCGKRMIGMLRDVSARKSSEAELQSLKDTFKDLFHLNPLPMWVFDLESFMFLDVNEAAVNHYGYSKEEFLSMSAMDIRPEEDRTEFLQTIKNDLKPSTEHVLTVRHLKKSGEIIFVSVKGNSIRYGSRAARIAVAIDISEKLEYEKALIESERRFKTLIQESSDFIAIVNPDLTYKYVSPPIERLLGVKPEQLIGKNAFEAIQEHDREALATQLRDLEDKQCIKLDPYRIIDQHGNIQWMETIITDLRNDSSIAGIVCNARIVTDRVEQEMKIKEHYERFSAVSKATSDVIWDFDIINDVVLWSQGIEAVFGYQEFEVNFQWWYDRVHQEDVERVTGIVNSHVHHRLPRWTSEYRFRCADGNYKYVQDSGFLIFDEQDGNLIRIIGALQDISERVTYTKTIEAQNRRLKEIAWSQAHLVRAPLTSILGLLELLKDPATDEITRNSIIVHLESSAAQLDGTIKDIISRSQCPLQDPTS